MALTLQEAQFYRDNFTLDTGGVPADAGSMAYRAAMLKSDLTVQSSLQWQQDRNAAREAFSQGLIDSEERDALYAQADVDRDERRTRADQMQEAFKAGDPNAINLAGQLWYQREGLPTALANQAQGSGGGGGGQPSQSSQSSQPSQPESVPTAFMEAAKRQPTSSAQRPSSSTVGSGGLVDLGGGMQANSEAQIDDANKLIFTPTVNVARAPGLIASSNPQLYKLDAPTVRLPVNY